MLHPKGRGTETKLNVPSKERDTFGWWLNNQELIKSPAFNDDFESSASSTSMLSCIDSEDSENYTLAQDSGKHDSTKPCEKIELSCFNHDDLDVDLIEKDAIADDTPISRNRVKENSWQTENIPCRSQGVCYTPERLVRSQEYRILTPSPRYLSVFQAKITPEYENPRKARRCRQRLNFLIDSNYVGATQLKALLDPSGTEIRIPAFTSRNSQNKHCLDATDISASRNKNASADCLAVESQEHPVTLQTPDLISSRFSYERSDSAWEDCKKLVTRRSSPEDTSGIQSNDWSSDTHSDAQTTPLCHCDELTIPFTLDRPHLMREQERNTSINKVVSILEKLDNEPEKARLLLDEDRFCECTSSHDQLTRLALSIETDESVPTALNDPKDLVRNLRGRVEKLQIANKDIYRDICNLRRSFQCSEKRVLDLTSDTAKLREEIHEMRYLDDLLSLLRGELERISKRNWPFVIGHMEHQMEEINLIV